MSVWIESMMDLMTMGRGGLDVSLSDARFFLPDVRVFWILAFAVGFWFLSAFDNAWSDDNRRDHKSDNDSE